MGFFQQPIQDGRNSGRIAKNFPPVFNRSVCGDDICALMVSAVKNFEQIFRGVRSEFSHAELIQNQQMGFNQFLNQSPSLEMVWFV